MKKSATVLLVAAIIITMLLAGCSSNTQPNPSTAPSITTEPTSTEPTTSTEPSTTEEEDEVDVFQFPELETSFENLDAYRAEVSSRLEKVEEGEDFLTDEEHEILKKWAEEVEYDEIEFNSFSFTIFDTTFNSVSDYYYPLLYREGHSLVLWYTSERGSVLLKRVEGWWNDGNYIGHLHCDSQEEDWIKGGNGSVLTWDETAKEEQVKRYYFGEVVETFTVPEGAVYCGFSAFEGCLFRVGSDVYALDLATQESSGRLTCIAHNVQFVLDCAYALGSDPWSQPLFLMEDGQILAYCSWEGDKDSAPDDPSHLVAPWYEGSYDRT
jgi:hypothetical protein